MTSGGLRSLLNDYRLEKMVVTQQYLQKHREDVPKLVERAIARYKEDQGRESQSKANPSQKRRRCGHGGCGGD